MNGFFGLKQSGPKQFAQHKHVRLVCPKEEDICYPWVTRKSKFLWEKKI